VVVFSGHPSRRWGQWSATVDCGVAEVIGVEGLGGHAQELAHALRRCEVAVDCGEDLG
jgi:hypothetical protein